MCWLILKSRPKERRNVIINVPLIINGIWKLKSFASQL